MLAVLVSSSLVQPLFGLWSDRRGAMWLLPGGLALAAIGTGPPPSRRSYGLVVLLVFVAGIGIAAYHPEGAKFAAFASGRKRASGMSYFNIGGNTGYALGPIVVTPLVLWLGLGGGLARDAAGARRAAVAAPRAARSFGGSSRVATAAARSAAATTTCGRCRSSAS